MLFKPEYNTELFNQKYNQNDWKDFLKKIFVDVEFYPKPKIFTDIKTNVAEKAERIGVIILNKDAFDEQIIAIYDVTLAKGIVLERNRVGLRNLLRSEWKNFNGAFIAYHKPESSKWRFTYVSDLGKGHNDEGEFGTIQTDPKRYTYVLGKGESTRTITERFGNLALKGARIALEDIKKAFSVEKLSEGFFNEYKEHYEIFCKYMLSEVGIKVGIFNGDEKAIRDFSKKLLGRIVFLYFIQKKGWLGVPQNEEWGNGDVNFLTNQFTNFKHKELFYTQFLSKLFFETLNKKRPNDLFKINNTSFKVPYLNGGLFEEEDTNHQQLTFKPELFKHLFEFFDKYNFTIYEDDPNDHTIAVDPEMLGHIFENLLEDNKDKGAYYTPKEIVHYMCQQSLIEYLTTWFETKGYEVVGYTNFANPNQPELFPINEGRKGQMMLETNFSASSNASASANANQNAGKKIDRTLIEKLLKKKLDDNDKNLIKEHATEFNKALDSVKICDPAIGSGAFPMGLLQEIFMAKQTIHFFKYGNATDFDASTTKLNIIQNSIYGVDIEKGAVDIARLRFWLSLIVDEDEPKALPNLDYKIVVGNSLVSKLGNDIIDIDWTLNPATHGLFGADLAKQKANLLKKISRMQKEFFNYDSNKKLLSADIRNLKIDLLITQLELMVKTKGIETQPSGTGKVIVKQTELHLQTIGWIKSIKELQKLKTKAALPLEFFDWKLDFPEVMNEYLFDINSNLIETANAQIFALNKQIDAVNLHLDACNVDEHLIHLQTNVAQSQITIVQQQLKNIEKYVNEIYGELITVDSNIIQESDLTFVYKITAINKGIESVNDQIDTIHTNIIKQNPKIGFDIVIGNPPYVQCPKGIFSDEKFPYSEGKDKGKQNLYKVFVEHSYNLLKSNGIATMIVQSSLMCDISSQYTRELLLTKTKINHFIEFPKKAKSKSGQVFDNVLQGTCIYSFNKSKPNANSNFNVSIDNDVITILDMQFEKLNQFELMKIYPNGFFIPLVNQNEFKLILKINSNSIFFSEMIEEISQGDLNLTTEKNFFSTTATEVKLLRGKNTHKYEINYQAEEYIAKNYKAETVSKNYDNQYFVCQQVTGTTDKYRIHLALTQKEKFIFGNSVNKFLLKEKTLNHFILSLLNSKLIDWYFRKTSTNNHVNGYEIEQLPIKLPNNRILFEKIVSKILLQKAKGANTADLEAQIDNLVYKLYELRYLEVKVIDPAFALTEQEYEALQLD